MGAWKTIETFTLMLSELLFNTRGCNLFTRAYNIHNLLYYYVYKYAFHDK